MTGPEGAAFAARQSSATRIPDAPDRSPMSDATTAGVAPTGTRTG